MNLSTKNLILVPYDRSRESEKALDHALEVAEVGDEIRLFLVISKPRDDFFSIEAEEIPIQEIEQHLDDLKSRFNKDGISITSKIQKGNIIEEILKESNDSRCKLIVLGFKGITRIGNFKLGSVSGEVAKRAKVPVLIVK